MNKTELKKACKNCISKKENNNICPMPDKCAIKNINKQMGQIEIMLKSFNKYFGETK